MTRPTHLALAALTLAAVTASSVRGDPAGTDITSQIQYTSDGDTVHLRNGTRARLTGFDAPELFHPQCPAERVLAEHAKARMETLTTSPGFTLTDTGRHDRYGRVLATATVADQPVAALMIREGLAVPFPLGHKPDWCAAGGVR